jgi:flagellar protein FliS
MELVTMLYDAAIESVQSARQHLANRQIRERAHAITRTVEILVELSQSLDHQKGGALSERLAALYDYMQRILLEANSSQTEAGLVETENLLKTLREAWQQVTPASSPSYGSMHSDYRSSLGLTA